MAPPDRRYTEGDSGYSGQDRRASAGLDFSALPMWAKAVGLLGFPIFVALYFMAQHSGFIPSPSARVEPLMSQHMAQMEALSARLDALVSQQAAASVLNRKILTQVCRNTAKNDFQITSCD